MSVNREPMTLDEIMAIHGRYIVHVCFSFDSEWAMLPRLEFVVQDRECLRLTYIFAGGKWHVTMYAVDFSEYIIDPDDVKDIAKVLAFAERAVSSLS